MRIALATAFGSSAAAQEPGQDTLFFVLEPIDVTTERYSVLDLGLRLPAWNGVVVELEVENVLDRVYAEMRSSGFVNRGCRACSESLELREVGSMKTRTKGLLSLLLLNALIFAACSDDTTGPDSFTTEELITGVGINSDQLHTLEMEGTFTVSVQTRSGRPVTDFEVIRLERRLVGGAGWTGLELARDGDFYVVKHTFEVSGRYELRVSGKRASDDGLVVLYEGNAPLEVVRVHSWLGFAGVELETFPGHIHAGDQSEVTFWVTGFEQGLGPPVAGLAPTIWVEVNGVRSSYPAQETQPGVYAATHGFTVVGPALVGIRVRDPDGEDVEWSVAVVVHAP